MNDRTIAYFSMEIALDPALPTYAGGLGVLAGDTLRSAAELKVPMVGLSLLHRKGYFSQKLDASGWQQERPTEWAVESVLQEMPQRAQVTIQRRAVHVRAWKYEVKGFEQHSQAAGRAGVNHDDTFTPARPIPTIPRARSSSNASCRHAMPFIRPFHWSILRTMTWRWRSDSPLGWTSGSTRRNRRSKPPARAA